MNPFTYVLGPMIVSIFLNTYVAGLVGFQYAIYKSVAFQVSWPIKTAVSSLWIIDLFQIAITIYMGWMYFVTNYDDGSALQKVALWTFSIIPLCNAVSSIIAHVFMASRLHFAPPTKFTRRCVLFLGIFVTFSFGLAAGLCGLIWNVSMIDIVSNLSRPSHSRTYRCLLLTWFSTRLAVDAALTGSQSIIYKRQNGSADVQNDTENSPLVRYALRAIQSGAATTLFSLLCLVTFVSSPNTTTYVVFLLPSGRLYSNIVLTTITSQARLVNVTQKDPTLALTADIWAVPQTTNIQTFNLSELHTTGRFADTELNAESLSASHVVGTSTGVSSIAGEDTQALSGEVKAYEPSRETLRANDAKLKCYIFDLGKCNHS